MMRHLAHVAALGLLVDSGLLQGHWTGRWRASR